MWPEARGGGNKLGAGIWWKVSHGYLCVCGVGGRVVAKSENPQDSSGCRMETGLEEMRVGQVICITSL